MTKQVFVCKISEGGDELFGGREGTQHHSSVSQKKAFLLVFILEGRVRVNSCVLSSSEKSYTRRYKEEEAV